MYASAQLRPNSFLIFSSLFVVTINRLTDCTHRVRTLNDVSREPFFGWLYVVEITLQPWTRRTRRKRQLYYYPEVVSVIFHWVLPLNDLSREQLYFCIYIVELPLRLLTRGAHRERLLYLYYPEVVFDGLPLGSPTELRVKRTIIRVPVLLM